MILKKIKYFEKLPDGSEWKLEEFELGQINLFVGHNAAGKTRTLNVISDLTKIFKNKNLQKSFGNYFVEFQKENDIYKYQIEIENNEVHSESFICESDRKKIMINRTLNELEMHDMVEDKPVFNLKIDRGSIAAYAVTESDYAKYPESCELCEWAKKIRHFRFCEYDEKNKNLQSETVDIQGTDIDETANILNVFKNAVKNEYKVEFINSMISDLNLIGFDITEIGIENTNNPTEPMRLYIQEKKRTSKTYQNNMSNGMFRAVSILIHLNFILNRPNSQLMVIDDLGEGLDFRCSTGLIKLLIRKIEESNSNIPGSSIQLLISTNDQFVMNCTDLKYWQIVIREGEQVNIKNYFNSEKKFNTFNFMGLPNFEYFRMGLYDVENINPEYKNTMLAFIDILGFKEWLKQKKLPEIVTTIVAILKTVTQKINHGNFEIKTKLISDSLVIWAELESQIDITAFFIFVSNVIAKIHKIGNVVTRGCIANGDHFSNEQIWISKVFVESYKGESEAIYPRTILLPSAMSRIKCLNQDLLNNEFWIKTDIDGFSFINYLNVISEDCQIVDGKILANGWTTASPNNQILIEDIKRHKETIRNGFKTSLTDQKTRGKYFWLANYHNNFVKNNAFLNEIDDLQINLKSLEFN